MCRHHDGVWIPVLLDTVEKVGTVLRQREERLTPRSNASLIPKCEVKTPEK